MQFNESGFWNSTNFAKRNKRWLLHFESGFCNFEFQIAKTMNLGFAISNLVWKWWIPKSIFFFLQIRVLRGKNSIEVVVDVYGLSFVVFGMFEVCRWFEKIEIDRGGRGVWTIKVGIWFYSCLWIHVVVKNGVAEALSSHTWSHHKMDLGFKIGN